MVQQPEPGAGCAPVPRRLGQQPNAHGSARRQSIRQRRHHADGGGRFRFRHDDHLHADGHAGERSSGHLRSCQSSHGPEPDDARHRVQHRRPRNTGGGADRHGHLRQSGARGGCGHPPRRTRTDSHDQADARAEPDRLDANYRHRQRRRVERERHLHPHGARYPGGHELSHQSLAVQ